MKDNRKKNKNDQIYKNYAFNQAGMLVQFILFFFILVFAILSIFNSLFVTAVQLTTGVALLVMAYNNHRIYKRKSFTIVYMIIGVLILFFGILEFIK